MATLTPPSLIALNKKKHSFAERQALRFLLVSMVEASEASRGLAEILDKTSVYSEETVKLIKQIKGAMTYPVAVIGQSATTTPEATWHPQSVRSTLPQAIFSRCRMQVLFKYMIHIFLAIEATALCDK